MGWAVLYIAFGVVALWLLGEVLLQYKARLRWRLLAFFGFLGVVIGVLMPSVWVIGAGTAAFAVGQTFVTLSFRQGFSTGWALGGMPGASKRRRPDQANGQDAKRHAEPVLEVSELEETAAWQPAAAGSYKLEPMPDDTGQYGVYDRGSEPAAAVDEFAETDVWGQRPDPYASGVQQPGHPDAQGRSEQDATPSPAEHGYAGGFGYPAEQPTAYAAYSDPYVGGSPASAQSQSYGDTGGYAPSSGYSGYDSAGYDSGGYPQAGYGTGGYQQGGYDAGQGYSGDPAQSGSYGQDQGAASHPQYGYNAGYGQGDAGYGQSGGTWDGGYDSGAHSDPAGQYPAAQQAPADGMWVPQQRDAEPEPSPYPYDSNGYPNPPQRW
ncbi:hypothetical protein [Streptomyces sparsus]